MAKRDRRKYKIPKTAPKPPAPPPTLGVSATDGAKVGDRIGK